MVIQKQCPQSACFRCLPSPCLKPEEFWRTLGAHPIEPLPFGWVVHSRNYPLLPPLLFHTTQTNQGWTHFRNDKEGIFDTLCPRRQITVAVRFGSVCSFVWVFAGLGWFCWMAPICTLSGSANHGFGGFKPAFNPLGPEFAELHEIRNQAKNPHRNGPGHAYTPEVACLGVTV